MEIILDGKSFTQKQLDTWKRKRVHKVLRTFRIDVDPSEKTDVLCQTLVHAKMQLSLEEMRKRLKWKLIVSAWAMKLASIVSRGKRRVALATIYAEGITAEGFSKEIDKLMLEATEENQRVNLSVCPDHYVLNPYNNILEVIETTGNSPLPTQFFITFDEETGIKEVRDLSYSHQSVGVAKLRDGTIVGGVRHQFRDAPAGLEARLLVEFPSICPKFLLKAHQKHLATEWSGWISWVRDGTPWFKTDV